MVNGKKIACPSCSRKFKTRAAMQQHRDSVHKTQIPAAAVARRRARGPPAMRQANAPQLASGSDLVGIISVASGCQPGRFLVSYTLNPRRVENTRLSQMSELWARWRPMKLRVKLVSSGSAMTYGTVGVGWCPDANSSLITGTTLANMSRLSAFKPNVLMRLNQSAMLDIPPEPTRRWYHTAGPLDESSHGSVIVVVMSTSGGYTGSINITVTLEWSVQFEGIELETTAISNDVLTPDAGWQNLFTTSDGSFDSSVLTFKMHHGGDMCPFSGAHPAKVYTTAILMGTKVYYLDERKAVNMCYYFARVQGYSIPGLLLFSSQENAAKYIRTGDLTLALKYYGASDEAQPEIPKFKVVGVSDRVASDPEVSMLRQELDDMREVIRGLGNLTLVRDTAAYRALSRLGKRDYERPLGTTADPYKVFVEDPVSSERIRIERMARLSVNRSSSSEQVALPSGSRSAPGHLELFTERDPGVERDPVTTDEEEGAAG